MAGGVQRSTERALGGNASLQELAQVAVLHVLEHGTQRTLVLAAADSQQADDIGVLQTSRRPRVLVKLRPIRTTAAGGGAAVELEVSARGSATSPGRPLCAGGVYGRPSPVSLCSLRGPPGALHSDVYWPAQLCCAWPHDLEPTTNGPAITGTVALFIQAPAQDPPVPARYRVYSRPALL